MSYLQQQMNFLKYDKRLLEINLKNGNITKEEYDQYLADLVDDETNATTVNLVSDSDNQVDSMNGGSHPADPAADSQPMPTNNDPFGSGF